MISAALPTDRVNTVGDDPLRADVELLLRPVCQWESHHAELKFGHGADARSCASASAKVRPLTTWIRSTQRLSSLLEPHIWESDREDTALEI